MSLNFLNNKWFLIIAFVLLCVLSVICSIKWNNVGIIVSALGSIASLYAIIEALIRVKSIETQNTEIRNAVENKISVLNKHETSEQVSKYVEVIARILSYIEARNAEAAILKIDELQIFLHNIQCNPTTASETKKIIARHQKTIKHDVLVLRDKTQIEPFPKDADCKELAKHFEALHDALMLYSQQIHFDK